MRVVCTLILLLIINLGFTQQLYVGSDAVFTITKGANLEITGDLENDGIILNTGEISLFGNWEINNIFNGVEGILSLVGGQDQQISIPSIRINDLNLNQNGEVSLNSDEFIVMNSLTLNNGVLRVGDSTDFILERGARSGTGSVFSYVQGKMIYRGSGILTFPVGWEGIYSPITFLDVFGTDTELSVFYQRPNTKTPLPDDELIGVSGNGIWELELTGGSVDPTPVEIIYSNEDLENFEVRNDIRFRYKSPVIAISNDPGGVFTSLGINEDIGLQDTDTLTYGTIQTEIDFTPSDTTETTYFAIGLSPRIPPDGLVYIPEIFSPAASDPANRAFRIFGEKILSDNFRMEVYNRLGSLVYSTESFQEANQIGWNGTNQRTGNQEPSGLYFYQLVLTRESGLVEQYQGPFYLQR